MILEYKEIAPFSGEEDGDTEEKEEKEEEKKEIEQKSKPGAI